MIRIASISLVLFALSGCAYETGTGEDPTSTTTQDLASSDAPGSDPTTSDVPPAPVPATPKVTFVARGLSVDSYESDETAWGIDSVFEVYGYVSMQNLRTGQVAYLDLGRWGNPSGLSAVPFATAGSVNAPRLFDLDEGATEMAYSTVHWDFAKAALCRSSSYSICNGAGYLQNNNKLVLDAKPGDEIRITTDFRDYDWGSADDNFCAGTVTLKVDQNLQLMPGVKPVYWDKPYGYNGYVVPGRFGVDTNPNYAKICYLHWLSPRP